MRDRAVDLPIQRTIDFIFYLPNSVTHAQGLMCKKFRSIMKSKQHPITHTRITSPRVPVKELIILVKLIRIYINLSLDNH